MNVHMWIAVMVFSMAVGQQIVVSAQPATFRPGRTMDPHAGQPASSLGSEIRRFLAQRSQASLERAWRMAPPSTWLDAWDENDLGFHADEPFALGWDEPYAEPCTEPGTEPCHPSPLAAGRGAVAISLVQLDGWYEIEAALADHDHRQKYRAAGSREEIVLWMQDLPPRVQKAILRQMPEWKDRVPMEAQKTPTDEQSADSHPDKEHAEESPKTSNDTCNPEGEER